jgi:hypothetical protein
MFIFEYNSITKEVECIGKNQSLAIALGAAVPEYIYFFAELAPLED